MFMVLLEYCWGTTGRFSSMIHDAEEERAQSSSDGDESGDLDTECGLGEKNFKRNAHTPAINKSFTKYVEIC